MKYNSWHIFNNEPSKNLETLKMKYDMHFEYTAKGIMNNLAWKATNIFGGWDLTGETNTAFVLIFSSDGTHTTNPKKVMKRIEKFYSDSYAANDDSIFVYTY